MTFPIFLIAVSSSSCWHVLSGMKLNGLIFKTEESMSRNCIARRGKGCIAAYLGMGCKGDLEDHRGMGVYVGDPLRSMGVV